jgi:hypothetical protein
MSAPVKGIVTMKTFEQIGEAQLLAIEGQRQIAAAVTTVMLTAFRRVAAALTRHAPAALHR